MPAKLLGVFEKHLKKKITCSSGVFIFCSLGYFLFSKFMAPLVGLFRLS